MTLKTPAILRLLKAFSGWLYNSESEMCLCVSWCLCACLREMFSHYCLSLGLELHQWSQTSSCLLFVSPVDLRSTYKSNQSTTQPKCRSIIPLHVYNQMVLQAHSNPWTSDWALIFMTTPDTCLNHRGMFPLFSRHWDITHFISLGRGDDGLFGFKKKGGSINIQTGPKAVQSGGIKP